MHSLALALVVVVPILIIAIALVASLPYDESVSVSVNGIPFPGGRGGRAAAIAALVLVAAAFTALVVAATTDSPQVSRWCLVAFVACVAGQLALSARRIRVPQRSAARFQPRCPSSGPCPPAGARRCGDEPQRSCPDLRRGRNHRVRPRPAAGPRPQCWRPRGHGAGARARPRRPRPCHDPRAPVDGRPPPRVGVRFCQPDSTANRGTTCPTARSMRPARTAPA